MDARTVDIARKYFNPRTWSSGTEQMAPLLYSLIRMVRPANVVEYGSGYTTLFILEALADCVRDFAAERLDLVEKAKRSCSLEPSLTTLSWNDAAFRDWFGSGGRASAVDPAYYLAPYTPHLYCFENHSPAHPYVVGLVNAVEEAGLSHLFSLENAKAMAPDALPDTAKPIDLVWWDYPRFDRCFRLFWPVLKPDGGLMIWHDVASAVDASNWETFRELIKQSETRDMEVLVLPQPHKLDQNSCAILRRTTTYQPPFSQSTPKAQLRNLRKFLELVT